LSFDIGEQFIRYFLGIVGAKFLHSKKTCAPQIYRTRKNTRIGFGAPFFVFFTIACGHDLLPRCGFAPHIKVFSL
jgi:hypothetical protein